MFINKKGCVKLRHPVVISNERKHPDETSKLRRDTERVFVCVLNHIRKPVGSRYRAETPNHPASQSESSSRIEETQQHGDNRGKSGAGEQAVNRGSSVGDKRGAVGREQ